MALLATLSNKQRSQLCAALKPIHVPQGTMLVAKGEVGDAFYIIESGICQVLAEGGQVRTSLSHGPKTPYRLCWQSLVWGIRRKHREVGGITDPM